MKGLKHDQKSIRRHNSLLLLRLIKGKDHPTRAELARDSELSATSVSRIVGDLIEQGLVEEAGEVRGRIGRNGTVLRAVPHGVLAVGVTLEVDLIRAGIIDLFGETHDSVEESVRTTKDPEVLLNQTAELIQSVLDDTELPIDRVKGVGVSIPGIVDWPEGRMRMVPQFHWRDIEVRKYLEENLEYPVLVDNQVKTVLLGEYLYGSIARANTAVCLYVGSGVGGAVINNGKLLRGSRNAVGEIGHVTMKPDGALCDCGRLGCLQTYISSSELEKEAGKPIQEIFDAHERGEGWANRLIDQATKYLSMALSNVACLYNPDVILLAGEMVERWPDWIESVQERHGDFIWDPLADSFQLCFPDSGAHAELVGASSLILTRVLQSPLKESRQELNSINLDLFRDLFPDREA